MLFYEKESNIGLFFYSNQLIYNYFDVSIKVIVYFGAIIRLPFIINYRAISGSASLRQASAPALPC